jgi:hypothetical protein
MKQEKFVEMSRKQVGIRVYEDTKGDLERVQRILSFQKDIDQTIPDVVETLASGFLKVYESENKTSNIVLKNNSGLDR